MFFVVEVFRGIQERLSAEKKTLCPRIMNAICSNPFLREEEVMKSGTLNGFKSVGRCKAATIVFELVPRSQEECLS